MGYTLGIDIGIASIGFAGVHHDLKKILFSGVHIFEAAENPKDGASLATPRREKRSSRRVFRRRSQRKIEVRKLLQRHKINCLSVIDEKYSKTGKNNPPISPWDLRKEACKRLLLDEELAKTLFHIAKHRGFQSNKKSESNDGDEGKALKGASELYNKWMESGEPTIGAFISTLPKKRNGNESYDNFIKRDWLREEIKTIFECQRKFGNTKTTPDLLKEYSGTGRKDQRNTLGGDGIAFYQRPIQSSEHMIGPCTFEKGEKRAPKFSYTAELFVLWTKLNNCKIRQQNGEEFPLTPDQKQKLCNLAHKNKTGATYAQSRKELDLQENERFNISYRQTNKNDDTWEKIRTTTEKSIFLKLAGYHSLKDALDTGSETDWKKWMGPDREKLDDIARIVSFIEDKKEFEDQLSKYNLSDSQFKKLSEIKNFSKTVDLSLKALRNIVPEMEKGLRYDEACEKFDYKNKPENKKLDKLPPFENVRNPVVNRALAQARKVINACLREHGKPETIIVELAREVGKPKKGHKSETTGKWIEGRDDLDRKRIENEALKKSFIPHVAEILGIIEDNVTGEDTLKYRLWYKEQQKLCFYCGCTITTDEFKDGTATQIDHILPYSRSWDDSYMNKTLCHTSCNQKKKNQTPHEWLQGTPTWNGILANIHLLPKAKAERFLTENFKDREGKWKDRALNDTRYMARLLKSHLEENLDLGKGNRIQTRNGSLTAHLRGAWGFPDKDRANDRHHGLDAIILACSTQSMVQELTNWNKYEARRKNPAERPLPPKPWETFREDAKESVSKIFVSRMPVRKITGAAHEDTIRSIRFTKEGDRQIIQRVKLKDLTLGKLEDMVGKDRKNNKIYPLLKERLEQHAGDGKKAFIEPIYMPTNDKSKQGPRINSVRILTTEKSGIEINHGLASNGAMVRVDVFSKPNKKGKNEFYLCPIYVNDFSKKSLPNKVAVSGGNENEWVTIDETFSFRFSIQKNDFIRLIKGKEDIIEGYFVDMNRNTVSLSVRRHDNDPLFGKDGVKGSIGVKTLMEFEKYSVDYFGRKHKIEKEKRLGVANSDDSKSGAPVPKERAGSAAE